MNLVSTLEEKEKRYISLQQKTAKSQKFEFASYELALQVREVVYLKLIQFDTNNDQQFQQTEIRQFLVKVLHQNQQEIHYFVKNVFRYDINNDGIIEYDQLVNFCMEQHFGEIAIQRLHRKKVYEKGAQRIMSFTEFEQTIKYALAFIAFTPEAKAVNQCFCAVDTDKDGYISYEDYFRFLKEYFGSKSMAAKLVNKSSVIEQLSHSGNGNTEISIVKKYSKYEGRDIIGGGKTAPESKPIIQNNNNIKNTNNLGDKNQPSAQNPQSKINIIGASNLNKSQYSDHNNNGTNPSNLSINYTNSILNYSNASNQSSAINEKGLHNSGLELTVIGNSKHKKGISLTEAQTILADRIAKLVYIQVRAALIYYDNDLDCSLTLENLRMFIRRTMLDGQNDQFGGQIIKKYHLNSETLYNYDEATRAIIGEHISRIFKGLAEKQLSLKGFVDLSQKICSVAKNTPLKFKYEALFDCRSQKTQTIALSEVERLYTYIFDNYPKK